MSQKFLRGHRVRIAKNLGPSMSHFRSDCEAVVIGSYSDQYGTNNHTSYSLLVIPKTGRPYSCSWYHEGQLTKLRGSRDAGEALLQKNKDR